MVIGGIKEWVMQSVITSAITKLISMFNPAGAIVQAAMAIYNTVMFFIERGSQIAALAEAVFNSIGSIAAGNVAGAANYVEQTMGRSLPVMISFLARLLGLGGVSEHIKNVIKKIQSPIENAMNKLANFIVEKGKSLLGKGNSGNNGGKPDERTKEEKQADLENAMTKAQAYLDGFSGKKVDKKAIKPNLDTIKNTYKLKSLEPVEKGKYWGIHGEINPKDDKTTKAEIPDREGGQNPIPPLKFRASKLEKGINKVPKENSKKWQWSAELQDIKQKIYDLESLLENNPSGEDLKSLEEDVKEAESKLKELETKVPTQEEDKKAEWRALVNKATHIPPAQYSRGKHWQGNSEDQRRNSSKNGGPGQFLYSMTAKNVEELEKETLLEGEVNDKGSGTYHAFKTFSQKIGYTNGEDAHTLRAELTSAQTAPTVHSHPR
jgi:hypothetical protein